MSRFDASTLARALSAIGALRPSAPAAPAAEPVDVRAKAIQITQALCRRFEGFYSVVYLCPAGVPTIGYGATYYADGRPVTMKDAPITREQAERLPPERPAAIIAFTVNLGGGNLRASTLRRKVNEGAWDEVPAQLMRWNKAGGRVLRGLTIRRQAEADLI